MMKTSLVTVVLCLMAGAIGAQTDTVLERILVKVNGDIVTKTDLENRQINTLRARGLENFQTDTDLRKALQEVTPQVIVNAVDELLLAQRGRELGYRLSDEQFRKLLDGIKEENKFQSDEQLIAELQKAEGMTLADLRRVLEQQMLISQVQQIEILNKVTITDIEAREYYDGHLQEFTEPATVTLREILIAVPQSAAGVNVAADDEARAKAQAARARVVGGEDLARVAAEVSDAPSKANGGLIGPIRLDELAPTIKDRIAALMVGEVSEPTRLTQGYQILKLEARTDAQPRPFDQVRDQISNSVFNDRRLAAFDQYLERLREQAIIEWKNEELKLAYEQYLRTRKSATPGV